MAYSEMASRAYLHRDQQKRRQPGFRESVDSCGFQRGAGFPSAPQPGRLLEPQMSNLRSFLSGTTPSIGLQYLPKTSVWQNSLCSARVWKGSETGAVPFFTLGDVWDGFSEWSAYGAGIPLSISPEESVVQYYVPYLSAIQLYARPGVNISAQARRCDDSDASDSDFRDSGSESSDCDNDRLCLKPGSLKVNSGVFGSDTSSDSGSSRELSARLSRSSSAAELMDEVEASHGEGLSRSYSIWSGCRGCSDSPLLLFEYFEHSSPYSRVPLADKVAELERDFALLRTLKSVELHPTSWLSVAWYPIYRIPTGPTLRDLGASFLTYHPLSSPMPDSCKKCRSSLWMAPGSLAGHLPDGGYNAGSVPQQPWLGPQGSDLLNQDADVHGGAALPAFGLATYKMKGPVWNTYGQERSHLNSLLSGADAWLKRMRIHHPDFDFFSRR